MNEQRFEKFQYSADEKFLEEAQTSSAGKPGYGRILALAACFCAVVLAAAIWKPWGQAQVTSPVEEVSAAELQTLGYQMELPENAQNVVYSAVRLSEASQVPMAQVDYVLEGQAYAYRALKTSQSEDISGINQTWTEDLSWNSGDTQLRLCSNGSDAWVGWYSPGNGTQWCLSGGSNAQSLLNQALALAGDLGIDFSTAPDNAENVRVSAFEQDGLTVAETRFTLSGISYAYRTAATPEVTLTDISGESGEYAEHAQAQVSWCDAQLSFTQGGSGKILWLDVVPGLVYSLSVESGASQELLSTMANTLFVPAQGDVG